MHTKLIQILNTVVSVITIFVIYLGHTLGPAGYFIPIGGTFKAQVAVYIATTTRLERRYSGSVRVFPKTGLLAMTAMYPPTTVTLLIFVAERHRLLTTRVDARWPKLNNSTHDPLLVSV
jgi:hypothetical protein